MSLELLPCDGCGQLASPEHLSRRFKRLEWTTRYRPVHIHTVFLSGVSPEREQDFLYAGTEAGFHEEGLNLLTALGIQEEGKPPDMVLAEFQRRGYFLTHVLECPLEAGTQETVEQLVGKRLPAVITRLKRSLKPKRLVFFSNMLEAFASQFVQSGLEAQIVPAAAFDLTAGSANSG